MYRLASSGLITPPCGVPPAALASRHAPPPVIVALLDRRLEPQLDQPQHVPDRRCAEPPTASARDAGSCRSTRTDRRPPHRCSLGTSRACTSLIASVRAPPRPVAIGAGSRSASKIGSSTSLAAVCTTRSRIVGMPSGRSPPPGFGIITRRTGWTDTPRVRLRQTRACFATPRRAGSHSSSPAASIAAKRHPVHARRALVGARQLVGVAQDVLAADLVVEQVEAERRLLLRLEIQLPLKRPDRSQVLPGSSPITDPRPSSKAHQKSGPFPPPALPGLNGTMTLSDSRQHRRPTAR